MDNDRTFRDGRNSGGSGGVISAESLREQARVRYEWIGERLREIGRTQQNLADESVSLSHESEKLDKCFEVGPQLACEKRAERVTAAPRVDWRGDERT